MKYLKSHFRFTKNQRNGIFLLLVIIVVLQCVYFFVDFKSEPPKVDEQELAAYNKEIDSLLAVEEALQQPKIYPFNPNYITDSKGYTLGMTNEEIDRLLKFRAQNKFVNSAKEFQLITKISDSLLAAISPYFKFPEWVTNAKPTQKYLSNFKKGPKPYDQKIDLNEATAVQLQRINGIGEALSERIIKFRNSFEDGFIDDIQLMDVYGLSPEVIERITDQFTVKTPRDIVKISLKSATVDQLVTIQHIDYPLAYEIIDQRTLLDGFTSFDELAKVKGFPVDKLEIIKLYLSL